MVVQKEFLERAHRIVWCTVATVGPDSRPRSRILHPIWELDEQLTGWIVTRATPVKVRHLANSPYVSCTYWEPGHDVAIADCEAEWVTDTATRQRVWELYRDAPPPLGYNFWSVFPDGPAPCRGASRPGLRSAGSEATGATREGRESQPHDHRAGGAASDRASPSLLRLTPYRLRLNDVGTLSGRKEPLAWP
ncbi:pyridoxamine 5'-phosphate oxidase family protein [Kribbella sp. NBC_00709]|uniref:pyridoxamine 5'-phosphate oxidase family protein n=1 Tax=Kribbella sp. NBC_00709 TaxID=2975972 RepID=UPI002E2CE1A6|nr:pyridoxamine 5'-phosphate oxidase family protein [Kribbella sp. NBC_00709]